MYKRTLTSAGPSGPVAYTCPAGKVALIRALHLANTTTAAVEVSVQIVSAEGQAIYLIRSGAIPKGAALNALDAPLTLVAGDWLKVHTPGAEGDVHAVLSLMEVAQ